MARRKLSEQNIRKLTKMGGGRSFGITLPISLIRHLKWRERQKLVIRLRGKKITIEDWPGRPYPPAGGEGGKKSK